MNKKDLAKRVAKELSITNTLSYDFINVMQDVMKEELQQNGHIIFQGFGVFVPWMQSERMGRNPKTGVDHIIESRMSVKFRPGKNLIEALNLKKEMQ